MHEPEARGTTLLVWFRGTHAEQWQNLNRVCAEWPYAIDLIEPIEPGDLVGCRLARHARDLGAEPIELEVDATRVVRASKHWVATLLERERERER